MANMPDIPSRPISGEGLEHSGSEVVDINAASFEQLRRLPGLDAQKARLICERRPFARWDEVQLLDGFGKDTIALLKAGGAEIRRL
ncbi:ComEA family DNA-binding protein [Nitratireductor thuwali]|uniref:Helix-hairpin-helix domain-containing protein n=1 Tax=Nitratireductor thuwali TaxID=2267699 RepID=A0ABY5MHV4_9HYPH|nr:hypothetical protein NTH_00916 [Nitratireductor thuwali]